MTIDDVFDHIDDSDFLERLDQWLDSVPYSRAGAEELLDLVSGWDSLEAYVKLLSEYRCFLTKDEEIALETNFKRIFDPAFIRAMDLDF